MKVIAGPDVYGRGSQTRCPTEQDRKPDRGLPNQNTVRQNYDQSTAAGEVATKRAQPQQF
jgi:hypothetical protein